MEAHDITLSGVHRDTARHVITTSAADEARPRKAHEYGKFFSIGMPDSILFSFLFFPCADEARPRKAQEHLKLT